MLNEDSLLRGRNMSVITHVIRIGVILETGCSQQFISAVLSGAGQHLRQGSDCLYPKSQKIMRNLSLVDHKEIWYSLPPEYSSIHLIVQVPDKMEYCQLQHTQASVKAPEEKSQHDINHISFVFHLKSLWLFTRSDMKSMIVPNLVFGFASAMSGSPITTNPSPSLYVVLTNIPRALLWLWLNLLLFNIANQRLPSSIVEDKLNKPWRPMPSSRLTSTQARVLLLLVIPTVFIGSLFLGATTEVFLLIMLTWMYNDLGGGDQNLLVRNSINAFGMSCYASGAAVIVCGKEREITPTGYTWIVMIGMVTMMTVQVQDLSDQEVDAARGRKKLPLVWGDGFTRCSIGLGVLGWSVCAPFFFFLESGY